LNYVEFYPGDYMRDTAHLSLTEHGAYVLLLLHYYATEKPLPNDNPTLFRIARSMGETEKEAVIKVANEFFPIDPTDGLRHSARADRETLKARARVDSARENGRKGGRPPKPKNNPTLSDPVKPNETQTLTGLKAHHTPHAIEEQRSKSLGQQAARKTASRFDEFWSAYPVKKGRADAEAKWKSRKLDVIADTIIADVKRRIAEDRQWRDGYVPHGSTYVNGRGWEDAIEPGRNGAGSETPDYLVGAI
jgi:uncharacterized protein YdaU (DUF1376 family)